MEIFDAFYKFIYQVSKSLDNKWQAFFL